MDVLAVPRHLRSYTCIPGGLAKIGEDTFLVTPTERSTEILTGIKCLIYLPNPHCPMMSREVLWGKRINGRQPSIQRKVRPMSPRRSS